MDAGVDHRTTEPAPPSENSFGRRFCRLRPFDKFGISDCSCNGDTAKIIVRITSPLSNRDSHYGATKSDKVFSESK